MAEKLKLLYVEDNPSDRDLLTNFFTEEAKTFSVTTVETGADCIKILSEEKFDLILLDNKLPDKNGIDILRELVLSLIDVPIILITGVGDEELAINALRAGADSYISKTGNYLDKLPIIMQNLIDEFRSGIGRVSQLSKLSNKILYIERNVADIDLTTEYLKTVAPHFSVTSVNTTKEGLKLLKKDNVFDVVLIDLRMMDMNALDFLKEIKYLGIQIPVIIVTGKGDENCAVAAVHLGAYDYIVKKNNYLRQLPYAIFNAINKFNLNQYNQKLKDELIELNKTLELKVAERTKELRKEIEVRAHSIEVLG